MLDFMSKDEQRRFKESVPHVHVPIELLEELSDHARVLQEARRYNEPLGPDEVEQIMGFYPTCPERMAAFDEDIPDIRNALECDQWNAVITQASATFD